MKFSHTNSTLRSDMLSGFLRPLPARLLSIAALSFTLAASPLVSSLAVAQAQPVAADLSGVKPAPVSSQLQNYRDTYQAALEAVRHGQFAEAEKRLPQLEGYSLYPYIQYEIYIHDIAAVSPRAYRSFQNEFADTPLAGQLKYRWLRHQARQENWQTYLDHYDPPVYSTRLQCHRLEALYRTGAKAQAFAEVPELWVVGHSQPKACDPVFNAWIKQGGLSDDYAWQRFWLAIDKGEVGLARYISRLIEDPAFKNSADTVLRLSRDPRELAKLRISPDMPGFNPMITYSLNRLVRYDKDQAFNLWQEYDPTLSEDGEKQALERRLGLYYLKDFHPESDNRLASLDPKFEDSLLLEWRLRFHLSQLQWQVVAALIEHLPADKRQDDRWQYWHARALEQQTKLEAARSIYQKLAQNRSFYGFLSAHRLGIDFNMNNRQADIDMSMLARMAQNPALLRARELFFHEQRTRARREWYNASRGFSDSEHYHAAVLAHRWGWHTQAIQSAIAARHWDDLQLRFPALYTAEIATQAKNFDLDNQLIFAVTRQESAFKADVRSPAGAVGLMQLMPATAKQTARSINRPYKGSYELRTPELNIELGSAYLSQMLKRYNGNRIYATAAYNAGPHRVKGWLEERGSLPIDMWIETIPFDETRHYVQNVLSYAVIYGDILGQETEFLTDSESATLPPLR